MYKTLKKYKHFFLIFALSTIILIVISKFGKNKKRATPHDEPNKSNLVKSSSKTKVSEESRTRETRFYKISGDFLEIYVNNEKKGFYSITKLKPEIFKHAKHITSSFKVYQNALTSDYNHHWVILIHKEFGISPDHDTKSNFCAIRKAMNYCVADDECPDQECT